MFKSIANSGSINHGGMGPECYRNTVPVVNHYSLSLSVQYSAKTVLLSTPCGPISSVFFSAEHLSLFS